MPERLTSPALVVAVRVTTLVTPERPISPVVTIVTVALNSVAAIESVAFAPPMVSETALLVLRCLQIQIL
jgi:hypothetical protein